MMDEVADARGAIQRAERYAKDNWNYPDQIAVRGPLLASLAVAWAMAELVAVSQPEPSS